MADLRAQQRVAGHFVTQRPSLAGGGAFAADITLGEIDAQYRLALLEAQ